MASRLLATRENDATDFNEKNVAKGFVSSHEIRYADELSWLWLIDKNRQLFLIRRDACFVARHNFSALHRECNGNLRCNGGTRLIGQYLMFPGGNWSNSG